MRNFLALLGWSPGGDREIVPEDEMIELFTLEGIQKKAAVFDTTKLEWMNGQYLSALPADELLAPVAAAAGPDGRGVDGRDLRADHRRGEGPLAHHSPRGRAGGGAPRSRRGRSSIAKGEALIRKMGPAFSEQSQARRRRAGGDCRTADWTAERLLEVAQERWPRRDGLKLGDAMQPIRVALTGSTVSEPVNELLAVVGRERSLRRIREVADR